MREKENRTTILCRSAIVRFAGHMMLLLLMRAAVFTVQHIEILCMQKLQKLANKKQQCI